MKNMVNITVIINGTKIINLHIPTCPDLTHITLMYYWYICDPMCVKFLDYKKSVVLFIITVLFTVPCIHPVKNILKKCYTYMIGAMQGRVA